ncbi:MAG: hypothetical protein JW889_06160 [Verrucomicrobia bacterium]|nr:hypothetical protein [Verrucomicrobiota bacterium]
MRPGPTGHDRTRRLPRVLVVLLATGLIGSVATGCFLLSRPPDEPAPKPLKLEPIKIDWSDPASVVEGFFDAKKRGDWKKAFSCCDYVETLGDKEAARILAAWKKEASEWVTMYRYSMWFIAAAPDIDEQTGMAAVSVVRIDSTGPGAMDTKRTGFVELCKLYGDKWKITTFIAPGENSEQ